MLNYRSVADLTNITKEKLPLIPHDIDLIVGVPRSGLFLANYISLIMQKPLTDTERYFEGKFISNGTTKNLNNFRKSIDECGKVLVVEDSVSSGKSIIDVKKRFENVKNVSFIFLAAYVLEEKKYLVDIFFEIIPLPRVFEWNIFHHTSFLKYTCFDIDGVLCCDPSSEENDDGKNYMEFIKNVKPKILPSCEIGYIVTSRLEKYRRETENWLKENNVNYKKLIMLNATAEERKEKNLHAIHKAEFYKKDKESILFIESEINQAIEINRISKKPVYCVENSTMYYEYRRRINEKKITIIKKFKQFLLKFAIFRYLKGKKANIK